MRECKHDYGNYNLCVHCNMTKQGVLQARVEELGAEIMGLNNVVGLTENERDALEEAARAVVERHKRKVSLNGLWYYEYESEELEALAALIGGGE